MGGSAAGPRSAAGAGSGSVRRPVGLGGGKRTLGTAVGATRRPACRSGLHTSEKAAARGQRLSAGGTGAPHGARPPTGQGAGSLLPPLPCCVSPLPSCLTDRDTGHVPRVTRNKRQSPPQRPRSPVPPCVPAGPGAWPHTGLTGRIAPPRPGPRSAPRFRLSVGSRSKGCFFGGPERWGRKACPGPGPRARRLEPGLHPAEGTAPQPPGHSPRHQLLGSAARAEQDEPGRPGYGK